MKPCIMDDDIHMAASLLGVEPAIVAAVCDVEAHGAGFLADDRPKILFEAHVFGRLTGHKYDEEWPQISAPAWDRSLYNAGKPDDVSSEEWQHDRLSSARELDDTAALSAASWGLFQIMGMNYKAAGFATVQAFVAAMEDSEAEQLRAFGNFCAASSLARALRSHDWSGFARTYNGPGQVSFYAEKLEAAYDRAKRRLG